MTVRECTCGGVLMFWHKPGCALLPVATECPVCECFGYHALGCSYQQQTGQGVNHDKHTHYRR